MKTKILFPIVILLTAIMIACGGEGEKKEANTLEAKKESLRKKRNELATLNQEVEALEQEIKSMDPTMAQKVKTIQVDVDKIVPQTFKHFVKVQGTVAADKNILVSPSTSGTLLSINVKEGQSVRKGQVLAKIDDAVIMRNLDEINTQLELATIVYEKQKRLWGQEIGTEIQYLTAKNQKESLEKRVSTIKEQWAYTQIKAPISGVVDKIQPKLGEMVSPGMPAFQIVNTSELSLKANLSERYIPYIHRGDIVKAEFATLNKSMDAKISVVGRTIEPTSRTFEVEVKLPRDPLLRPNMLGELSINDELVKEAIVVPMKVLQQAEKGNYVFVAEEKDGNWISRRKDVVIGQTEGEVVHIKEGLSKNDDLITVGYKGLSDGQFIQVNKAVATAE